MNIRLKLIVLLMLAMPRVKAQQGKVGINTDEPTQALDVNGDLKVRKIKKIGSSHCLVVDQNGVLGYYKDFVLHDIECHVATEPVDVEVEEGEIINDIPLQLETTLKIPAHTDVRVVIEYSVPVGIVVPENEENLTGKFADYAGVRFMREEKGKKEESFGGSRKYTVAGWVDKDYGTVTTVTNKYVEEFLAGKKDRVITYSLNAYVEHRQPAEILDSGSINDSYFESVKRRYRFNMYSSTPGENRNWGKGIMAKKVYYK